MFKNKYLKLFLFLCVIGVMFYFFSDLVLAQDAECKAGIVPCGQSCDDPTTEIKEDSFCTLCHLLLLLKKIIDFIFSVLIIFSILSLTISGILYLISSGSPQLVDRAKAALKYTLAGVAIALLAWLIINYSIFLIGTKQNLGIREGVQWNLFDITCVEREIPTGYFEQAMVEYEYNDPDADQPSDDIKDEWEDTGNLDDVEDEELCEHYDKYNEPLSNSELENKVVSKFSEGWKQAARRNITNRINSGESVSASQPLVLHNLATKRAVIYLGEDKGEINSWATHGQNVSNIPGSKGTPLGSFKIEKGFEGGKYQVRIFVHGVESMKKKYKRTEAQAKKIDPAEAGNSNSHARVIRIHEVKSSGGRTWGCTGLPLSNAQKLKSALGSGTGGMEVFLPCN